jgi:ketosteroid isomerase-like protein
VSEENVDLVRASWEAWERGDMKAIFGFYDPEIVWDQTHADTPELSTVYHGHDGVRQFLRAWTAPFESYYAHAEDFSDAGEAVVVRCRQGGRGKQSGVKVEMPPYWQVYRLRDGLITRIEVYADHDEAVKAVGLEEQAVSEESTTPLEERWRRAVEAFARGDSDEAAAAYAGRAVFDLSRLGIGIFEGREAIRGLFADWVEPYEEYQAECEEFRDLGNGVSFAVLLHGGRPRGSDGFVDVRHSYTMTWSMASSSGSPSTPTSTRPAQPPNGSPRNGGRRCRRRTCVWLSAISMRSRGTSSCIGMNLAPTLGSLRTPNLIRPVASY